MQIVGFQKNLWVLGASENLTSQWKRELPEVDIYLFLCGLCYCPFCSPYVSSSSWKSGQTWPTGGMNVLEVKSFSTITKHSSKFTVMLMKTVFAYFWIKLKWIEFAYSRKNFVWSIQKQDFCRCQSFTDCLNHSILFHYCRMALNIPLLVLSLPTYIAN